MAVRKVQSVSGFWVGIPRREPVQGGIPRQEPSRSEKTRADDGPSLGSELARLLQDGWVRLYAQRKIF